tara:strand:- start:14804 stop:15697 length:894 start_codon:yes stop_codon:yes gene_type:complete
MAYYPKSQITTNLHTNGGVYVIASTDEDYIGYFYKLSNGEKYTGKSPSNNNRLLRLTSNSTFKTLNNGDVEYEEVGFTDMWEDDLPPSPSKQIHQLMSLNYDVSIENSFSPRFVPQPSNTMPTQKDYDIGEFQRFFAKKNNENIYLEVDKQTNTFLNSQDSKIAWDLYSSISIPWNLSGDKDKTYLTNKNIVSLAEQKNKWYGFTQWFRDNFLKYYQNLASQENLYTSGKEFKTPNGREYIGPYHIHPQNGAMVGATHIKKKHDSLTPINSTILSPQSSSQSPPNISFPSSTGGGGY